MGNAAGVGPVGTPSISEESRGDSDQLDQLATKYQGETFQDVDERSSHNLFT